MLIGGLLSLWKSMHIILRYFLLVVLIDSLSLVCFFAFPQYQIQFTQSNMFVDATTAVLFFCVFLLALFRLIIRQGNIRRGWLIFYALFGFLSALDELQFIGHLVHFFAPYQSRVRFEDIHKLIGFGVRIFLRSARRHPAMSITMASIGFALAFGFVFIYRNSLRPTLLRWRASTTFQFFCIITVLFLLSTLLDQGVVRGLHYSTLWEEMIELDGSLALLFCYLNAIH
jgi:hypothetical protein